MNILIVGEYSGFSKHLKKGFKDLGHNVSIVMTPDSFKKFESDDDDILYGYRLSLFGKTIKGSGFILSPFKALQVRNKLKRRYKESQPDLIIVINYVFITTSFFKPGTPLSFLKKQLKRGSKIIMSSCGWDPANYYSQGDLLKNIGKDNTSKLIYDPRFSWLLDNSVSIVPTAFIYYDSLVKYDSYYKFDTSKIHKCVPLPITIDKDYTIEPCRLNKKIVIFHGIIRPNEKGTVYIQKAMNRLQIEMPDKVECICRGGIPYDEYVKLLKKIDILVDQTYGNGWGMNAIIGAMKGKCVLAPCGKENRENMELPNVPFIQIGPDSDLIYNVLKELVLSPKHIYEIKVKSREFAVNYCEASHIANQYIKIAGF